MLQDLSYEYAPANNRDFRPAGFMLRNLFGAHVSSDLLLLEDALSI
jgi:hypothetical protein